MNAPTWKSVACGIPGYDVSAFEYAKIVQEMCAIGNFTFALACLQDAKEAGMMHRLQLAVQEDLQEKKNNYPPSAYEDE